MVPMESLVLPQFMEFRSLHLLGTYWALILPAAASPVAVFVFRSFLKGIPVELIEAAGSTGPRGGGSTGRSACRCAGRPSRGLHLHLHQHLERLPAAAAGADPDQVADHPGGLSGLLGSTAISQSEVMASAVLGLLPLLVVFLVAQRQIVQGVASTGIK